MSKPRSTTISSVNSHSLGIRQQKSRLQLFRSRYILLALIPLLFLSATLLRQDNLAMERLRSQVLAADKADDLSAINSSLQNLKTFTSSHIIINSHEINGQTKIFFGTGSFYLERQYAKKAHAELEKAEAALQRQQSGGTNIYAAASAVCKPLAIKNGWAWNSEGYINCMMGEIARHPSAPDLGTLANVNLPSIDLYRYSYLSPLWAPTPAGFALLACLILIVLLAIRIIWWLILKIALIGLRRRQSRR